MHDKTPCKATTRAGKRCSNPPVTGATVCRMHGGAAPQVQRKAAERIAEARDKALVKLVALIDAGKVDARVALDAVVKLTEQVETLEGRVSQRVEVHATSEVDRELERLAEELRARADAGSPLPVATDSTT